MNNKAILNSAFVGKEDFCRSQRVLTTLAFSLSGAIISLHSKRFRGIGEQRKTKNRTGTIFCPHENGARAKIRKRGWGRRRKETLADKPLDFENLRSPANGACE